jgi:hypothetical protein
MSLSTGSDRREPFLIGRGVELGALVENIRKGRHTLLVGERGIGKSRLLHEAVAVLQGEAHHLGVDGGLLSRTSGARDSSAVFYIFHVSPMGDLLKELCARLHAGEKLKLDPFREVDPTDWGAIKKKLTGLGTVGVQNLVIESFGQYDEPPLVILDSLDRMTPAHHLFLERLMSVAVVCAAVVRMKGGGHLARVWASFARIPVGPLSISEAEEMVGRLLEIYPARLLDRRLYVRQVVKAAAGNPFHLNNLVRAGALSGRVTESDMRELQQVEEGELMNMGPAYIFLASIFTLFKIFSIGTDNSEFYVYFSAMGFLVYLTFRVFRTFFLFRPRRGED